MVKRKMFTISVAVDFPEKEIVVSLATDKYDLHDMKERINSILMM